MSQKIQSIEELINALNINTFNLASLIEEPKAASDQIFYAHISKSRLQIVAISPTSVNTEDTISIIIETDLAKQFLGGEESTHNWGVAFNDEEYKLVKLSSLKEFFNNRVDVIQIVELPIPQYEDWVYPDVRLLLDRKNNEVIVKYDGDKIKRSKEILKLYFTREGDPSYLKCAFSLDVNILSKIAYDNNLESWPNPVVLPVPELDDLSIFSIKSNFKIAIQDYENTNN